MLELLALLHLSQGDSEQALAAAVQGLDLSPSMEFEFVRAMALAASPGRDRDATEALQQVLESPEAPGLSNTKLGQAHLELADLLGRSESPERARDHFQQAAALLPGDKEVPFRLAAFLRQHNDLDGARAALERYQELNQEESGSLEQAREAERRLLQALREAQSKAQQDQVASALEVLEEVPIAQQDDARWRLLHAKLLFSMNRAVEALGDLAVARGSDPDNLEVPYVEAIIARSLGRLESAEASLRGLLALASEMGEAHYLLAVVLADQGRLVESVASYERAMELGVDSEALTVGLEAVRKQLASREN